MSDQPIKPPVSPPVMIMWRIKNIALVSFEVEEIDSDVKVDFKRINFQLVLTDLTFDPANKQANIALTVKIFLDETFSVSLGTIKTKAEFTVDNYEQVIASGGFGNNFIAIIIGVLMSTTRGMLILKSKDTPFEGTFLPVINPLDFWMKSQRFPIPKGDDYTAQPRT